MCNDFDWAEELSCAVTVCDKEGVVVYQNAKARKTFESYGNVIGKNLRECHSAASIAKIERMMADGVSNSYTIEKRGVKKMIHQTPWYRDGILMGLVEFSIEIPQEMPHFIR